MRIFYICNIIALTIWWSGVGYGLYRASESAKYMELIPSQTNGLMLSENQKEVISYIESNNNFLAFKKISTNNLLCCGINIGGGTMFSVPTLFNLSFYGYVLGFQIYDILNIEDKKIRNNSLIRILPHSFEIVGIWLSGSISFYITWLILCILRNRTVSAYDIKILIKYILSMLLIIICAAIVETYISPYINI